MFTVLGTIPVTVTDQMEAGDIGEFLPAERTVTLRDMPSAQSRWQTFWHESTHVAMYDSGACDALTSDQEEFVCNAMGTYLAAMMAAGYLRVSTPR